MQNERIDTYPLDRYYPALANALDESRHPMKIDGEENLVLGNILCNATRFFQVITEFEENLNEDRRGGCLVVAKRGAEWGPMVYRVGNVKPEKECKYATYAFGKAIDLAQNPDHLTSRQNEELTDGETVIPAGGIVTRDGWIISFSGFPTDLDEFFGLAIAYRSGLITEQEAEKIARTGGDGNKLFDKYRNYLS